MARKRTNNEGQLWFCHSCQKETIFWVQGSPLRDNDKSGDAYSYMRKRKCGECGRDIITLEYSNEQIGKIYDELRQLRRAKTNYEQLITAIARQRTAAAELKQIARKQLATVSLKVSRTRKPSDQARQL
jgi:transcriptional regulator NrdR family protein